MGPSSQREPDDVTLTLHKCDTPTGNLNGVKYLVEFLSGRKRVKFLDSNLQNYMLGDPHVATCTMGCAYGSSNKILSEWDPGPTYLLQRLWDPGGPSYTSISYSILDLEKLGKPIHYLNYIHLLALSSHPSLVILMLILAPKFHLRKLDHMGSFRYTPRLDP